MIELTESDGCILFSVKAQPSAKRNAITGEHAGMLKVAVTAAPEKGKANLAIAEVLAKQLRLGKSQLTLRRGDTSQQKVFQISGLAKGEVAERIQACLRDLAKT